MHGTHMEPACDRRTNMNFIRFILLLSLAVLTSCERLPQSTSDISIIQAPDQQQVQIIGYKGNVKEPFITPDGRFILFTDGRTLEHESSILYAQRMDPFSWGYLGELPGANHQSFDGSPSMDHMANIYFSSMREYSSTNATIFTGAIVETGVTSIRSIKTIATAAYGDANLEAEISHDGKTLYYANSTFHKSKGPRSANIACAYLQNGVFRRASNSGTIFANINSSALEYGFALTDNELKIFFTRWDRRIDFKGPKIYMATRTDKDSPFENIAKFEGLGDFVESPAVSTEEHILYYHRREIDEDGNESFRVYATQLP